ncbi:MAG: hypothetical protein ACYTAS_02305 [Planctomycetota bacterium]
MRSRLTQLATAALMITAVALSISFLEQSVTPAYAIEQTVEACRDLRFLYFEYFAPRDSEPIKECWIEFDSNGQPKDVRTDLHAHWNVVHIWKEGRTQTWRKEDNTLRSYEDEAFTAKILKLVRDCTPSTAVESLYERQLNGEVEIEISQPDDKTEPIAIKGTFLPGRYLLDNPTLPSFRDILYVDQTTKLVTAIEVYELRDGEYQPNGVWRSYKYNEPFGAEVFDIEGEVPDDVTRLQSAY